MTYIPAMIFENEELYILDQTVLPLEKKYIPIQSLEDGREAILSLRIRGAPAIGVMAAFTTYIEMRRLYLKGQITAKEQFFLTLENVLKSIGNTRPTAVNLFYAIETIRKKIIKEKDKYQTDSVQFLLQQLKEIAISIYQEDQKLCEQIGDYGNQLIFDGASILTHCNTGSLATSGRGTALGAIYTAVEKGKQVFVYNTETRPLLQGSRLTSFELEQAKIPSMLITDNMVASLFTNKKVDMVMVGADRIAQNGDTANKIGTLGIAILAHYFRIPFYVLAPSTTIDTKIKTGSEITIEEREEKEVKKFLDCQSAPIHISVYNPAFDITPAKFISAIITEKGIFRFPYSF